MRITFLQKNRADRKSPLPFGLALAAHAQRHGWCVMPRMTVTMPRDDTEGDDEILCTSQESVSCWCDGIERRLLRQHFDHHSNEELGACVCVLCVHALHTAAAPPPPPVLVVRSWSCFINAVVYMICVLGTNGTY